MNHPIHNRRFLYTRLLHTCLRNDYHIHQKMENRQTSFVFDQHMGHHCNNFYDLLAHHPIYHKMIDMDVNGSPSSQNNELIPTPASLGEVY